MTNYEQLLKAQMQVPEFAKAFHEARLERLMNETLENLKEQIVQNTPKEILLQTIDSFREQLAAQ